MPITCIQAPWSNPAWQASRAPGAPVWVLPPAATFLPPGCWVFLEESVWPLHPVPNLQSKVMLGPRVSLHPVTSSPTCHLPGGVQGLIPARNRGQSPAGGCWLSLWECRLEAGSLPCCKLEQDPVSSADSPLGNGCTFYSLSSLCSHCPLEWLPTLEDSVCAGMEQWEGH